MIHEYNLWNIASLICPITRKPFAIQHFDNIFKASLKFLLYY